MGQAFLVRRGGGKTNQDGLKIISVSSADSLPASAEKNTIAVVMDGAAGHVYVQSNAPETAETGDVYIATGRQEKSITLEGNASIVLDISGAYVKDTDGWNYTDTYLYMDGEWQFLWSGQLYDQGNEYDDKTGGWMTRAIAAASNSTVSAKAPTVTRGEESICAAVSSGGGVICTTETVNLTPYKSIVFEGTFTRGGTVARNFSVCVWSEFGSYYTSNLLAYQYMEKQKEERLELDVSSIEGNGYIGLGLTNSEAIITRCYLTAKDV